MSILGIFKSLWSKLLKAIKDPAVRKAAEASIEEVCRLIDLAAPAIQMVALATPTQADDAVVAAALRINKTVGEILALPEGSQERNDAMKNVAREVLRDRIMEAVIAGREITLRGQKIFTAEQVTRISNSVLNHAIEFAFDALSRAEKVEVAASTVKS